MLSELKEVLAHCSESCTSKDYSDAIVKRNILGKKTASTRRRTAHLLAKLYALDPNVTIFRLLRKLWTDDDSTQSMLALLCASARDPLLRLTAEPVLEADEGDVVEKQTILSYVANATDDHFQESTLKAITQRTLSSWAQAGHLQGRTKKVRTSPTVTPSATCYALLLAHLCGRRGQFLFESFWCRLLDEREDAIYESAREASKMGLMVFKHIGSVVEVSFPELLTSEEEDLVRGQD